MYSLLQKSNPYLHSNMIIPKLHKHLQQEQQLHKYQYKPDTIQLSLLCQPVWQNFVISFSLIATIQFPSWKK